MLIKNISTSTDDTTITLSADIIFHGEPSQQMYFRIEKKYKDFLVSDASPFVTALLLPCMKRGEHIIIEGDVPQDFLQTIPQIMDVVEKWDVGFKKIPVTFDTFSKNTEKPSAVGCFFSGGVDSFYTYLKHKKDISHLIYIKSWEIPPDVETLSTVEHKTKKLIESEGLKLITVESNYKTIIEPILDWEWNLGSNIAAVGLMLRNGLKTAYIPSGMRWDQLCPYGTHPDLDPLWSTRTITIYHDGCEYSRLEKVLYSISKSPLALRNLHVCTHSINGQYNCNKCFKCIQTKIALLCADALEKAETFDQTLSPEQIKKVYYKTNLNLHIFGEDSLNYLKQHNLHTDIQEALEEGLIKSRKISLLRKVVMYFAQLDKKYNHRRIYQFVFKMQPNRDRNMYFKTFASLGLIR